MFVTQRPSDKPNRTEKQMLDELTGAQGWLTINMVLSTKGSRRQVEVDGILITPEGIITVEAKAAPRMSGDLEVSINDDWYIGGEVANFSGKSNPFVQGRQAAQQVHTLLRAEDWRLPRINGSIFVGGNASLPGGPEDLGDVVVATSGQLADALRSKLIDRSFEYNERNRDPYDTPAITIEEAFLIADALGFPSRHRPTESQLRAEGFISGAEKRSWLAARRAQRARAEEERRARDESARQQRDDEARRRREADARQQSEDRRRRAEEQAERQRQADAAARARRATSGASEGQRDDAEDVTPFNSKSGWFPKRAIPALLLAAYIASIDMSEGQWLVVFPTAVAASLLHLFLVLPKHVPAYRLRVFLCQPAHLLLGAVPIILAEEGYGASGILNSALALGLWVLALSASWGDRGARLSE